MDENKTNDTAEKAVPAKNKVAEKAATDNPYLVIFKEPYTFEKKEYTQIDLRGLEDLTPTDFFDASQSFNMTEYINPRPEAEPKFCCELAATATGLPMEFFLDLPVREIRKVRNCVQDFFREEG